MNLPMSLKGKKILIAGCGGGYDVFAGVPVAIELINQGNEVFFSNYSFTHLQNVVGGDWVSPDCIKVKKDSSLTAGDYFPEKYLSMWLDDLGRCLPAVYCYSGLGVANLREALNMIVKSQGIDAIFVVDGGCDGIFRGDEHDLGTPSMDAISIIAASLTTVKESYYVLTAFGTEGANHEVSHAEALERIAELSREGALIGTCSLVKRDKVTISFQDCMAKSYSRMPVQKESNIVNSILAGVDGKFGYVPVTRKIQESPIWVSPLTSMYWFFDLVAVAKHKLFYKDVLNSTAVMSVANQIEKWRPKAKGVRPNIPI